ncbi:MAG: helix-hairpin-helix domain-containing protein [Bacteroidota bacterium]
MHTIEKMEEILEDASLENEETQIYDSIEYLMNNPILLKTASVKDLMRIPLINIQTARAIIRCRNLKGGIYKPEVLINIEGVSNEEINRILPFLKLGDEKEISLFEGLSELFRNIKFYYRFRTQNDLQNRLGFTNGRYAGSKPKFYNRLKVNSADKFYFGLLFEKDAGEKSFADFSSFHLMISDLPIFNTIILGDYLFEFGQGLALWSPYSFSKGTDAINTVSKGGGNAVPYTSADENQFFRGVALKLNLDRITVSPFLSYNKKDASIDSINNQITSLSLDGLHRTRSEIKKENSVTEKVIGTAIDFDLNTDVKIGLLYYRSVFSNNFAFTDQLKKSGNNFSYLSSSYSALFQHLFLSGEVAYNMTSVASIHTANLLVDKNFTLVFSFRNFPRNFINLHANSFGEKGTAQNEVGFYSGIKFRTDYGVFNIYFDQFKFPVAANNYYFSSTGNDFLFYYTNKIFTNTELRIKYKNETKDYVQSFTELRGLVKRSQQNYRAEIIYKAARNLQLRSRVEYVYLTSTQTDPGESGYLILQDIKYNPYANFNMYARFIFFSTDSYNSRLYQFENDVIGVMTNPPLYGEGLRWYLMVKYTTKFGLNISIKYSELYKPNERTLGSSDSEISGNLDNRLNFQIDFNF